MHLLIAVSGFDIIYDMRKNQFMDTCISGVINFVGINIEKKRKYKNILEV